MAQRILKFRVWDKKENRFLVRDGGCYKSLNHIYSLGSILLDGEYEHLIIQQFTGLKDKNGKDICEGDILEVIFNGYDLKIQLIGEVKFDDCSFDFVAQNGECLNKKYEIFKGRKKKTCLGVYDSFPANYTISDFRNKKVIGNIFENPELLDIG